MAVQVKAWGNGQGIRFSKDLLRNLGIRLNDYLDVEISNGRIILSKRFRHRSLEERAASFQGKVGPYEELPWV